MGAVYKSLNIPSEDVLTSIREEEAEFMSDFLKDKNFSITLEVGMAYGCSAAHILTFNKSNHIAIDPFQHAYGDIGLQNIASLGLLNRFTFIKEKSHLALPRLLNEGLKVDFAFIDGGHKFDDIFLDFYYIDLILNDGGYILFHDNWMDSTKKVISWIKGNRNDYIFEDTGIYNLSLIKKIGEDSRNWDHYFVF